VTRFSRLKVGEEAGRRGAVPTDAAE
jgi:hypothetical protein